MQRIDAGQLARVTGASTVGGPLPREPVTVGTDTRNLPSPALFVALSGERFDGHDYIDAAIAADAVGAVVSHAQAQARGWLESPKPIPMLVVDDPLLAYRQAARLVRDAFLGPVVALTGSNGKTSTKELCRAALGASASVHATAGNFNNLVGVPKTIFASSPSDEVWVLEMGMNAPGEIAALVEIAQPDVGLITNVGPAHLEGLGSVEGVATAKGEMFAGLPEQATAVINADDAHVTAQAEQRLGGPTPLDGRPGRIG